MKKLSHEELISRQAGLGSQTPIPFMAVLNDIRSLYNVGSLFRTADGAGLEKLWLCGLTGIPPDSQISKTALGAEKHVPWEYTRDPAVCLQKLRESGYQTVLLEQTRESIPYDQYCPKGPVCLIVGNEISGVTERLLPWCDAAIEIEMAGLKSSLNVTVAFGVAAYHIRRKLKEAGYGRSVPALNAGA